MSLPLVFSSDYYSANLGGDDIVISRNASINRE